MLDSFSLQRQEYIGKFRYRNRCVYVCVYIYIYTCLYASVTPTRSINKRISDDRRTKERERKERMEDERKRKERCIFI